MSLIDYFKFGWIMLQYWGGLCIVFIISMSVLDGWFYSRVFVVMKSAVSYPINIEKSFNSVKSNRIIENCTEE